MEEDEKVICPLCGEETDELIDTEGKINGSIGEVCEQCYEDYDIGK